MIELHSEENSYNTRLYSKHPKSPELEEHLFCVHYIPQSYLHMETSHSLQVSPRDSLHGTATITPRKQYKDLFLPHSFQFFIH
jgi:hypothetical protein